MVFRAGVIGTLTLTLIVNLTAFAIVREREVGTLEQIMVTPIRPIEFILGPPACCGSASRSTDFAIESSRFARQNCDADQRRMAAILRIIEGTNRRIT